MKIGLSYSRCIRDLVEGAVNIDDVLIIIARTDFDPDNDEQWSSIWRGYTSGRGLSAQEWADYDDDREEEFRDMTRALFRMGKIHQPRQFGAMPTRRREYWLEAVLPPEELERNPAAKEAWERFQVIAGLTNIKLDHDYH